jgi:thiol-disulfide isomerase/thioredoxin
MPSYLVGMNICYPLALSLLLAGTAAAQAPAPAAETAPRPTTRIQLNEQTVITDASGQRLPMAVWKQMLGSGNYSLIAAPGATAAAPAYQAVARTEAERAAYFKQLPPPEASPFFKTGQPLAAFTMRDMAGHKYSSKELAGKIVVLNFWFIGCPPCRMEIPELNKLVQQNATREDVVFLAVALDERAAIQEFVKQHPYTYALVPDGRYVAAQYGINSYPTNLVVDRQGKVVFHAQYHPNMAAFLQKAIDEAK